MVEVSAHENSWYIGTYSDAPVVIAHILGVGYGGLC